MRLMPFNAQVHRLTIEKGYEYILVPQRANEAQFLHPRDQNLQILKAIRVDGEIPPDCACEPVESETVRDMLQDRATDYFIILTDQ